MPDVGKLLILVLVAPKVPLLGKLTGDIHIRHGNFELHFPLITCIVLSLLLSLILNLFLRR